MEGEIIEGFVNYYCLMSLLFPVSGFIILGGYEVKSLYVFHNFCSILLLFSPCFLSGFFRLLFLNFSFILSCHHSLSLAIIEVRVNA